MPIQGPAEVYADPATGHPFDKNLGMSPFNWRINQALKTKAAQTEPSRLSTPGTFTNLWHRFLA